MRDVRSSRATFESAERNLSSTSSLPFASIPLPRYPPLLADVLSNSHAGLSASGVEAVPKDATRLSARPSPLNLVSISF